MKSKLYRTILGIGTCCIVMLGTKVAAAQTSSDLAGQKETGFALQTSVSMAAALIDPKLAGLGLSSLEGGMTFGYKFGRGMIGIGFDYTNFGQTETREIFDPNTGMPTGTEEASVDVYSYVIYPQFQIAMAQSADRRAELIADMSVGVGSWGTRNSLDTTPNNDESRIRLRWRVGPGVRYWVHPQVGVSMTAGITGNHMLFSGATASQDNSVSASSLFGQFGLLGVF